MDRESAERIHEQEQPDDPTWGTSQNVERSQYRTIRAVTSSTIAAHDSQNEADPVRTAEEVVVTSKTPDARRGWLGYNPSQESVCSRATNGETGPGLSWAIGANEHVVNIKDVLAMRDVENDKQDEHTNSCSSVSSIRDPTTSTETVNYLKQAPSDLETSSGLGAASQPPITSASVRPGFNSSLPSLTRDVELSKPRSHLREGTQIDSGQSTSQHQIARDETKGESLPINKDKRREWPAFTPDVLVPHQLLVTKKRFPILNVRQVSKGRIHVPSRNSSLVRSQSGLLHKAVPVENTTTKQYSSEKNKIADSLRKITPENVASLLRNKKSLAVLIPARRYLRKDEKENRPSTRETLSPTKVDIDGASTVSTPGAAYLAMRNQNSSDRGGQHQQSNEKLESPTDLVKATLSARLSKPFDTDIPDFSRLAGSMYLGQREIGHSDPMGDRITVAQESVNSNNDRPLGYDKRRSFERGPGGYGGLGPSPLGGQTVEHVLPCPATSEDRLKRQKSMFAMSQDSRRMVSNFLRSRRRAAEDEHTATHREQDGQDGAVHLGGNSPLFI